MPSTVHYRFESFLYPPHVSRIELEAGEAAWVYIRRRHNQLARERNEQVMLYVYNLFLPRWDYIGKTLPDGGFYDHTRSGAYELSADARGYYLKEGGEL